MTWIYAAVASLLVVFGAASEFPEGENEELDPQLQVAHLLDLYETLEEINLFMDAEPLRCVSTSRSDRICTWQAAAPHEPWMLLAAVFPTEYDVALVCELFIDGSPRKPGSCTAHPRQSNRGTWRIIAPKSDRKNRTLKGRREIEAQYDELKQAANREIAQARTAGDLSRLVGQGPDKCVPVEDRWLRCVWRADRFSYGHGTLAMSIRAPFDKKVRLECALPLDGGERRAESCAVEIGA